MQKQSLRVWSACCECGVIHFFCSSIFDVTRLSKSSIKILFQYIPECVAAAAAVVVVAVVAAAANNAAVVQSVVYAD